MEDFKLNFKNLWKYYLVKVAFLLLGLYLFTLGIAIYTPTSVGASHMDFSIFAIISTLHGVVGDNSNVDLGYYPNLLTLYFVGILIGALIFGLIFSVKDWKENKNKMTWINLTIIILADLIIVFGLPQMVNMQWLYIPQDAIANINNASARNWIFIGAYSIYVFGVAFWVMSGILGGPYNTICTYLMKATGWKYNVARIVADLIITFPGFIFILANGLTWSQKGDFMLTYLNFGSICFVILTGPIVGLIIPKINKVWNIEDYKTKLQNLNTQ
ncbi:SPE_1075/MLC_0560 family membrane protein [Spiroplasma endosymbiont of Othius punctulatus]|uniref:SPE_1075/MLC_0560 family membrane protein n=1 Tax=Spiroplasma endosymbiont of Othius punctulatus TaxID=3066289 RepID=UPI0030CE5185